MASAFFQSCKRVPFVTCLCIIGLVWGSSTLFSELKYNQYGMTALAVFEEQDFHTQWLHTFRFAGGFSLPVCRIKYRVELSGTSISQWENAPGQYCPETGSYKEPVLVEYIPGDKKSVRLTENSKTERGVWLTLVSIVFWIFWVCYKRDLLTWFR